MTTGQFFLSLLLPVCLGAQDISMPKRIIGAEAAVTFTPFDHQPYKARVDTGASVSSLHCRNIRTDNETATVSCIPLDQNRSFTFTLVRMKQVKSANGTATRPCVKLEIGINGETFTEEFTLTDRSGMTYPVLIGRPLLKGRYLVDVEQ